MRDKWGDSLWLCLCDCGNKIIVRSSKLKSSHTKSCGCLRKEKVKNNARTHGHSRAGKMTGIYKSWANMIQRCTNPNCKEYKYYGGRGIMVCKRWMKFENFLKDTKKKWKPGLTLERDNNQLGYFKDNCYWATWKQQQRNKRNNRLITAFGKTQCIAAWAEETGINRKVIEKRLKLGWPPERALTEPVKKYKRRKNG